MQIRKLIQYILERDETLKEKLQTNPFYKNQQYKSSVIKPQRRNKVQNWNRAKPCSLRIYLKGTSHLRSKIVEVGGIVDRKIRLWIVKFYII